MVANEQRCDYPGEFAGGGTALRGKVAMERRSEGGLLGLSHIVGIRIYRKSAGNSYLVINLWLLLNSRTCAYTLFGLTFSTS